MSDAGTPHPAEQLAQDVVTRLLEVGVREAVLSPGSRNAPLSFALLAAERAGLLRLHTRIDERSGGFLALGLARASGRPVLVSCTSGTAVANLAPAVLEAHHARVPLVVVAADRPARLRGTSANQTTVQAGLLRAPVLDLSFGDDVEAPLRKLLAAGGPVHLNVQFDDPLTPHAPWIPDPVTVARVAVTGGRSEVVRLPAGPRTVVVAGDSAGTHARDIAERGGWPLLAEPTSGARGGAHALRTHRLLLGTDLGAEIERVVLLGHPTLSRPVSQLLARADVEVVDVGSDDRWSPRPFQVSATCADVEVDGIDGNDWLARWQDADRALSRQVDALVATQDGVTPYGVAAAVARALPGDGLLFAGPSNPIRDLDLMMPARGGAYAPRVWANRGLAGIDGVVSSAIGAALAVPTGTRCVALLGDVTFLHDANGLVLGPDEPAPDLTLVVVNDDGGSIFSVLEQGAEAYAADFERIFGTPHGVDVAALCAATRTPHWQVDSVAELEHALASPSGGIEVVEVRVRRDNRRELDQMMRGLRP